MKSANNYSKRIYLFLLVLYFFILTGCSNDNITEPVKILGNVLVIDTLDVNILYDDTPGFKYPMMKHEVSSVAHLTKKGNISGYRYICADNNIDNSSSIDYLKIMEQGYRFKYNMEFWNPQLLNVNSKASYSFQYYVDFEDGNKTYTQQATTTIHSFSSGIKPEANSVQLTGPIYWNYQPQYSKDGKWIYYKNSHSIFRTNTNGGGYEEVVVFNYPEIVSIGRFDIVDNNHLAYILWQPNKYSKIVIVNLQTLASTSYEVHGYLWGTLPVKIPNTNEFLNLQDFNTSHNNSVKLLTADITTQKVDTLLNNLKGDVGSYTINPVNNNLYVILSNDDVMEYNFGTKETSVFLSNVKISELKFFPNGVDYGYIKKDDNGFKNIYLSVNGVERQLTKYPGDVYDFNISPDGDEVVFSSKRRGEVQSWKIKI